MCSGDPKVGDGRLRLGDASGLWYLLVLPVTGFIECSMLSSEVSLGDTGVKNVCPVGALKMLMRSWEERGKLLNLCGLGLTYRLSAGDHRAVDV